MTPSKERFNLLMFWRTCSRLCSSGLSAREYLSRKGWMEGGWGR